MQGSCLCGQVAYHVDRLVSEPRHCSCRTCRKSHAAAFNTSASVEEAQFRWLRGEELLRSFESSAGKHRFFCSVCGSQLIARQDRSTIIALRVATLDEDPGLAPKAHIWVSSEVPWLAYGSEVVPYDTWESNAS